MAKKAVEKKPAEKKSPHCPFCDAEVMAAEWPFCQACHGELVRCTECLTVIPKGKRICPKCGTKVKAKTAS